MAILSIVVAFFTFYAIYTILALSMNLEYGFGGLPNFGKVFFYSAGAYTAAVFSGRLLTAITDRSAPYCSATAAVAREQYAASEPLMMVLIFLATIAVALVVGGVLGYVLSWPALRIRDVYLGLLLLVVAEIGRVFVRATPGIICGPHGVAGIPNPLLWIPNPDVRYAAYALLCLVIAALCYLLVSRIVNSPYGRLLKMVRDDEDAAQALGKRTARIKMQAMVIGSALAAVAGVLYAFYSQFVGTEDFAPFITFLVLVMVILGGAANNLGSLFGVLVFTAIERLTRPSILAMLGIDIPIDITYIRYMVVGLVLTVMVMFRPQGLFPERPLNTPAWEVIDRREKP